jgi:hypothetical protein
MTRARGRTCGRMSTRGMVVRAWVRVRVGVRRKRRTGSVKSSRSASRILRLSIESSVRICRARSRSSSSGRASFESMRVVQRRRTSVSVPVDSSRRTRFRSETRLSECRWSSSRVGSVIPARRIWTDIFRRWRRTELSVA